ncbi:MAG: hypothetical protein Q6J44_06475, partial [Gloeomargarita sp. DG02_4_bins_56]
MKLARPFRWLIVSLITCIILVITYLFALPYLRTYRVPVTSQMSLIHVGSNDSFAITPDGISGGRYVLEMLEKNSREAAQKAVALYNRIIPRENYGGEY